MAIAPEQTLVSEQYVQLLTRQSLTTGNVTTPIAHSAGTPGTGPGAPAPDVFFPLPVGQGLRIVNAAASITDPSGSDQLTLWSAQIFVWAGNGFFIFNAPIPVSMVKLGIVRGYFSTDELILATDYMEQGGIPPNVHIGFEAVVANADTVNPHNVVQRLDLLVEYYTLKPRPMGHIGYP